MYDRVSSTEDEAFTTNCEDLKEAQEHLAVLADVTLARSRPPWDGSNMPLYLVRWPTLIASLVRADDEDELVDILDQDDDPGGCTWEVYLNELLEDRFGERATIVTSQLPVDLWHDYIGDPTTADAICDRLLSMCYRIVLKGPSRRKESTAVN